MECYDAHIHCFYHGSFEEKFMEFKNIDGFLGGCLLMFEEAPLDREDILKMVPGNYHNKLTVEAINPGEKILSFIKKHKEPSFIPYMDTRFFNARQAGNLKKYVDMGFRGVKVLYVPEYDKNLDIKGWEISLGRRVDESEQVMADLFSECLRFSLPVLFHADLRTYGGFVSRLLAAYPEVNVNIPHFGSSRKEMAHFLEKHTNCYTDFSSLLPFIKESPDAYISFIKSYSDRILFGSDALISGPHVLKDYMDLIGRFLDEEIQTRLLENYIRFHSFS